MRRELNQGRRGKTKSDRNKRGQNTPQTNSDSESNELDEVRRGEKRSKPESENSSEEDKVTDGSDLLQSDDLASTKKKVQHVKEKEIQLPGESASEMSGEDVGRSSKKKVPFENEIARDITYPDIYTRRVTHSNTAKSEAQAERKKNERVYNKVYACLICNDIVQHIPAHMKMHKDRSCVQNVLKTEEPNWDKLRKVGCDIHNRQVVEKGDGEIVGLARMVDDECFDVYEYGPCPSCRQWLTMKGMKKHFKKCQKIKEPVYKKDLIMRSRVLAGHIRTKPSTLMVKEVFKSMNTDTVGRLARNDDMIVSLGESWLRRNIDNVEKRRYYASQRMRLAARLLQELQKLDEDEEKKTMEDYIKPGNYDHFVKGALNCCFPYMDDEDDLHSPSNAIKLKYDIKRMANAKYAFALRRNNKESASMCKQFLKLMDIEWSENVTKLARTILATRRYIKKKELPSPEDVKKLTDHLYKEIQVTELKPENFHTIAELCEVLLTTCNKRRTGEVEVIK